MNRFKPYFRGVLVLWTISLFYLWTQISSTSPMPEDDHAILYFSNAIFSYDLVPGPGQDYASHYTPAYGYMIALIWGVFGKSYTVVLAFIMLGSFVAAISLASRYKNWEQRLLVVAIYIPLMLMFRGGYASLNAQLIPFACMAYALFRFREHLWSSLLIGLLLGMAIMTKQMAILFVPAFICESYWIQRPQRLRHIGLVLIGLCVPFLIYCAYIQTNIFTTAYYFMDYGHLNYLHPTTDSLFTLKYYIAKPHFSLFVLLPVLWLTFFKFKENRFALMAFYCSYIPLCFQIHEHYILLVLPWSMICLMRCLDMIYLKLRDLKFNKKFLVTSLVILVLITSYKVKPYVIRFQKSGHIFRDFYGGVTMERRNQQIQRSTVLRKWGETYGPLYSFGDTACIFFSDIVLPDHEMHVSFYRIPENEEMLDIMVEKKYPIALIIIPAEKKIKPLLHYFKDKGYVVSQEERHGDDEFYLLTWK